MKLFAKIVNGFKLLNIFAKSSILDFYLGFEYASAPEHSACLGTNSVVLNAAVESITTFLETNTFNDFLICADE